MATVKFTVFTRVVKMSYFTKRSVFSIIILSALICFIYVSAESYAEKDTPLSKISQNVGGATINIFYCYSCGYRKVFEDYSSIIQQKYPAILIYGDNYEPTGINLYLSKFIGIAKMIVIACIIGGVNVTGFLGWQENPWWTWFIKNKMYSCMMIFFVCNMVEGQLVSSGAFEIFLNNIPVWSKLETGRIPQPPELFQIIDTTLHFNSPDPVNSNFVK